MADGIEKGIYLLDICDRGLMLILRDRPIGPEYHLITMLGICS